MIRKTDFLYPHQLQAVDRMFTGCILNGGTGSGKSRTALYYYFSSYGGYMGYKEYEPMKKIHLIYILSLLPRKNTIRSGKVN